MQSATASLACRFGSIGGLAAERQWTAIRNLIDGYSAGSVALDSKKPFDEDSICRVHLMTKVVTGIATMLLVENGTLSLDRPVADIQPEWRALRRARDRSKNLESHPATKLMTIRHLLTHMSGLGDWSPSAGSDPLTVAYRERGITPGNREIRLKRSGYGPQAADLKDMVQRVADLPLVAEPGTAYLYSSVGYAALGLATNGSAAAHRQVLPRTDLSPTGDDVDGVPRYPRAGRATHDQLRRHGQRPLCH
jgi:CubicO group peptidase (beta-lactamase class C family)